jgi:hypothetical protein
MYAIFVKKNTPERTDDERRREKRKPTGQEQN